MIREFFFAIKDRAARGRNGLFRPHKAVLHYHGNGRLYLEILSKRAGKQAPIIIPFGVFDALEMGDALVSLARSASIKSSRAAPKDGPSNEDPEARSREDLPEK
jgi:hypothetical protein